MRLGWSGLGMIFWRAADCFEFVEQPFGFVNQPLPLGVEFAFRTHAADQRGLGFDGGDLLKALVDLMKPLVDPGFADWIRACHFGLLRHV